MKSTLLTLVLWAWSLATVLPPAAATDVIPVFSREIQAGAITQDELLSLRLDSDIFAYTRDGLPDVRVLDNSDRPAPFVIRKVQTTKAHKVHHTWAAKNLQAKPQEDGSLEITVRLDENDPQPMGLRLITPLRDFEQRVRVFQSADAHFWEPIGKETVIFDYSRYVDVRNDAVSFPASNRRHIKVVIDNVTVEQESELKLLTRGLRGKEETERAETVVVDRRPFRIDRLEFWRDSEQESAAGVETQPYPIKLVSTQQKADKQQTVLELQSQRQPLTSLEFVIADSNFSRRATLEEMYAPVEKPHLRQVGDGTLSRVDFKSLHREQLTIEFPETRVWQLRVVIENRDSPPLTIQSVRGLGPVYELVFLASKGEQYRLIYGSASDKQAKLDVAAVVELLGRGFVPTRTELGPAVNITPDIPFELMNWTRLFNNRWLLGSVIAVLVVLLGLGLYRAAQRVDNLPS